MTNTLSKEQMTDEQIALNDSINDEIGTVVAIVEAYLTSKGIQLSVESIMFTDDPDKCLREKCAGHGTGFEQEGPCCSCVSGGVACPCSGC